MNRQNAKVIPALSHVRRDILCPKCHVVMSVTNVAGIPVEKCPSCEGTFFDKGEVETLIRKKSRLEKPLALVPFRWN